MSRSPASLAALLLTQRLVDVDAAPLKASEFWSLPGPIEDFGNLLRFSAEELTDHLGDRALAERAARLLGAATAVAFRLEQAEQSGLQIVTPFDEGYPQAYRERLRASAPPLLYAAGDLSLLAAGSMGIVGARALDAAGDAVGRQAAVAAVDHGLVVVSGRATPVDRLALEAAVEAGGAAVGVLADSLLRTVRDAAVRRAIGDGTLLLCTPYKPSEGFTVANAVGRNKLIYALTRATFVVAADDDKDGTWTGAVDALRRNWCPVLAWTGDGKGPGNDTLVARGARAVPDLAQLFPLPDPAPAVVTDAGEQLALELP